MKLERTIDIDTTPDHLWTLLTDVEQIKRWMPDIVREEPISEGPPGIGTRSRTMIREGKRVVAYDSEIVAWEPRDHLGIELRGGSLGKAPMRVDYRLVQDRGTVSLSYAAAWQPRGLFLRLLSPLIDQISKRNICRSLERLSALATG